VASPRCSSQAPQPVRQAFRPARVRSGRDPPFPLYFYPENYLRPRRSRRLWLMTLGLGGWRASDHPPSVFSAGTGRPPVRAACARGSIAKCSFNSMNGSPAQASGRPGKIEPTRMEPAAPTRRSWLLSLLMAAAALVVAVLLPLPRGEELLPRAWMRERPIDQAFQGTPAPAGGDKGQETGRTGGPGAVETGPGTGPGPAAEWAGASRRGRIRIAPSHLSAREGPCSTKAMRRYLPRGRRAPEIALVSGRGVGGDEVAPGSTEFGTGPRGLP